MPGKTSAADRGRRRRRVASARPATCGGTTRSAFASCALILAPQALDILRELRLAEEEAALLLADHRMPGMTGVEFLEHSLELYPTAKRVLLTAYADIDAAIHAINMVGLDYYLLKPWSPPEQKLYPVLDELIEDWLADYKPPFRRRAPHRAPLVGALA